MGDIVDYLRSNLQALQKRLEQLERRRALIEMEMGEVGELYRATKAVLEAELEARGLSDTEETSWAAIKSKLRTMTLKDAIHTIVSAQGEEGIHLNDILEKIKDAGFPLKSKTPKKSIVGTIYHEIKNHGAYERIAPNTFRAIKPATVAIQNELLQIEKS